MLWFVKLTPILLKQRNSSYVLMTRLDPNQTHESRVLQAVFNTWRYSTKEIQRGWLVVQSVDPCCPHKVFSPSTVTCTSSPCLQVPGWSVTEHLYLPLWLSVTLYKRTNWEEASIMLWCFFLNRMEISLILLYWQQNLC